MVGEPAEAMRAWQSHYGPWLSNGKYYVSGQTQESLVYTRMYYPGPAVIAAVLFFPIGLIALVARKPIHLNLQFARYGPERTLVKMSASALPKAANDLCALAKQNNDEERARQARSASPDEHAG